jgi:comEA protein
MSWMQDKVKASPMAFVLPLLFCSNLGLALTNCAYDAGKASLRRSVNCLTFSQAATASQRQEPNKSPSAVIDINRASAEELQKLPGIGPKLAQQIVAFREKHGPFRRVEDLLVIKGIGPKKWKAIRPHVVVSSKKN